MQEERRKLAFKSGAWMSIFLYKKKKKEKQHGINRRIVISITSYTFLISFMLVHICDTKLYYIIVLPLRSFVLFSNHAKKHERKIIIFIQRDRSLSLCFSNMFEQCLKINYYQKLYTTFHTSRRNKLINYSEFSVLFSYREKQKSQKIQASSASACNFEQKMAERVVFC